MTQAPIRPSAETLGLRHYTVKQLRYVVAVARTGSLAAAATAQSISVSSVREAVRGIEADLGVRLFRGGPAKGMRPTQEGLRFVNLAEQLLSAHESFERAAARLGGAAIRDIEVGVLRNVAPLVMARIASALIERFPEARFRFDECPSQTLATRVRDGRYIAGFGYDDGLHPSLTFRRLFRAPLHVGLHRTHWLAGEGSVSLDQLAEDPFIALDFEGAGPYYAGLFERHGIRPSVRFIATSTAMARHLIGAGLGYSVFNMIPLEDDAAGSREIARVPLETDYWTPAFGLIHPAEDAGALALCLADLCADLAGAMDA